jgi:hypothetical protein
MASPNARIFEIGHCVGAALRAAHYAIRPARLDHIGLAVFEIAVEEYRLLKSLWRVHEFSMRRLAVSVKYIIAQLYLKKAQLKRQPNQHAAVLLPGQQVQLIKVATLRELPVTDRQCEEFRLACIESAGCYKSPEDAEAELAGLENKLLSEARPAISVVSTPSKPAIEDRRSPSKAPIPIWNRNSGTASGEGARLESQKNLSSQRKGGPKQTV